MDKVFYNEASANKLGWTPEWFGCNEFDEKLVKAIRSWQKENELTADGLCGPSTHRRIFTQRVSKIDEYEPLDITEKEDANLVYRGNFIPIDWGKVVLWSEPNGLFILLLITMEQYINYVILTTWHFMQVERLTHHLSVLK